MKIVSVIPIARGVGREELSYFSLRDIGPGALVKVPLRSREAVALVVSAEDAEHKKSELRRADFSMKKIKSVVAEHFLPPEYVMVATEMARLHATTTGSALYAMTPKPLLEHPLPSAVYGDAPERVAEVLVFQADDDERFAHYKSLIREAFAKNQSVFVMAPTARDAEDTFTLLSRGVEQYAFLFRGSSSTKVIAGNIKKALLETHPVLIVGTPAFLALPRSDLGVIVVEREHRDEYKMATRPFIDFRRVAQAFSIRRGITLIFGDILLRTETLKAYDDAQFEAAARPKMRYLSNATIQVVPVGQQEEASAPYDPISPGLRALIRRGSEAGDTIFLFTARRGLSSITICHDCGKTVTCALCSAPVVLHKDPVRGGTVFVCHTCGARRSAKEMCARCGGWNLVALGTGAEKIEEAIKDTLPNTTCFVLTSDRTPTTKEARRISDKWRATPGSVLIGTEMALPYLGERVDRIGVVSIDSLFAIPDFRISEKIFSILVFLRVRAGKEYVVQTRIPEHETIRFATEGNTIDFYRGELEQRKTLGYPPFATLIKITMRGTPARVRDDIALLKETLLGYDMSIYPAFVGTVRREQVMHALLSLPTAGWPDESLLNKLLLLPPSFTIDVNPQSTL